MALKSTIYKAVLQVSDIDRNVYGDYALTLACHPSETPERLMVRLLAYALNADEHLAFGKGLSSADEPDLALSDLTGVMLQWIEVGQPDERTLLKACGRAASVRVYAYSASVDLWWKPLADKLARAKNLSVYKIAAEQSQGLARLAARNMALQCIVQDGQVWVSNEIDSVQLELTALMSPGQ